MAAWLAPFMTALKGFTCFWSLVTLAVAAATQSKLIAATSSDFVNNTNLASGNAILACAVFALLYFVAALVLLFLRPESILISVMVDTIVLGCLFIFALGSTAGESSEAGAFSRCSGYSYCALGSGLIGVAWIFTFLLLGLLVTEVAYTLVHYGGSYSTWRTPFHQLLHYGTSSRSSGPAVATAGGVESGVAMGSVGHQPQMQQYAPQTVGTGAYQPPAQPQTQAYAPQTQAYAPQPQQQQQATFPTPQPTGASQQGYGSLSPAAGSPQAGYPSEKAGYAAASQSAQQGQSDVRPLPNVPQGSQPTAEAAPDE